MVAFLVMVAFLLIIAFFLNNNCLFLFFSLFKALRAERGRVVRIAKQQQRHFGGGIKPASPFATLAVYTTNFTT